MSETTTTDVIDWELVAATTRALAKAIPSVRYARAMFETFKSSTAKQAAAAKRAEHFARKLFPWINSDITSHLWLLGPPGTGKTHLACSVLREAVADEIENGNDCQHRLVSHVELMREWARSASKRGGSDEAAFFSRYSQRGQLLVLDDIREPRSTEEADALDWLIECRYRQECTPVVLTSNLNLADLRKALGDRTFDRLRDGALIANLDGASHRARFAWEGPPDSDEEAS